MKSTPKLTVTAEGYVHLGTEAVSRPAIGAAPRFKVKKAAHDTPRTPD